MPGPCLPTLLLGSLLGFPTEPRAASTALDFDAVWWDGRAEVCGYHWRGVRYGEERRGEAVAIFVTESLDAQSHVKVDDQERVDGVVNALKLNLVRDFQTGIYDYDTMVSCFVRSQDFALLKLSFSAMEWCGHVYEELDVRALEAKLTVHSYFEGESARRALDAPHDGLVGEQLFIWLRGLRGAPLAAGEERRVPYLSSPFERRLRHLPAAWGTAEIARDDAPAVVEVPAGSFPALTYRVATSDGSRGEFRIEEAEPHRVLSWTWHHEGELTDAGELCGSRRLRYWELQSQGQEKLRAELGLTVPQTEGG